jgi:hypothetical protein
MERRWAVLRRAAARGRTAAADWPARYISIARPAIQNPGGADPPVGDPAPALDRGVHLGLAEPLAAAGQILGADAASDQAFMHIAMKFKT